MTRVLYGLDGDGAVYDEIDDVVERFIDNAWPYLPPTLTVLEFKPRKVEDFLGNYWFDSLLESLSEELDYDEAWEPTPRLLAARDEFVEVLKAEYHVRACEPTGRETVVDLRDWLGDNEYGDGEPIWEQS